MPKVLVPVADDSEEIELSGTTDTSPVTPSGTDTARIASPTAAGDTLLGPFEGAAVVAVAAVAAARSKTAS